jgi:hypothetical protein
MIASAARVQSFSGLHEIAAHVSVYDVTEPAPQRMEDRRLTELLQDLAPSMDGGFGYSPNC